jgi:nucleotide-binding universal stress UspA family protein
MKVLLATDGSEYAGRAEQLVASLEWPEGSLIKVLRVHQGFEGSAVPFGDAHATVNEGLRGEADAQLMQVRATLARSGRQVETVFEPGYPPTTILEEAQRIGAELIVLGSRGRGLIASTLLGSVAAAVIDHASCPVLVARQSNVKGIVLADDGSASAREAADTLARWPMLHGGPIQVVSVVDRSPQSSTGGDPTRTDRVDWNSRELVADLQKNQERIARDGVAYLAARGVTATATVRSGAVAQELMRAAEAANAHLIVVGSRGRTGVARAGLGSVARSILLHAPCSVLVVHRAPGD